MRLFIYGSLLSGESNHAVMAGARCVGPARTLPCFELVDLGPYPAMLDGGTVSVVGEVYEVDDALCARIDDFEGHPEFYRRTMIDLADEPVTGKRAQTYLYVLDRQPGRPRIGSGDWRAVSSSGRRRR